MLCDILPVRNMGQKFRYENLHRAIALYGSIRSLLIQLYRYQHLGKH